MNSMEVDKLTLKYTWKCGKPKMTAKTKTRMKGFHHLSTLTIKQPQVAQGHVAKEW